MQIINDEMVSLTVESYAHNTIAGTTEYRWIYNAILFFGGNERLFGNNHATEEDAIAAGKERLAVVCKSHIAELEAIAAKYQSIINLCNHNHPLIP